MGIETIIRRLKIYQLRDFPNSLKNLRIFSIYQNEGNKRGKFFTESKDSYFESSDADLIYKVVLK